jgi:fibronectin-binding autotransporter adhesin
MKSTASLIPVASRTAAPITTLLLAALLFLSAGRASADYLAWVGNDDGVWNDEGTAGTLSAENWSDLNYGPNGRTPQNYDLAIFNQASPQMTLSFSAEANPFQVFFEGNGAGYTIGSADSAYGLEFNNFNGITIQSTLAGTGGSDTVNAPITDSGILIFANFSPTNPEPTLAGEGVAGSNNTLNIGGPVSLTGTSGNTYFNNLLLFGDGNINISGNITAAAGNNSGAIDSDLFGGGTLTLSGTNSITQNSAFGGNAVFDYTTNNTDKVSETGNLDIGYQYTNYSGNVGANGGNITILGNQSSATTVNVGSARFNGSSTLTVVGGIPSAPTTVNLGNVYGGTYGSSLDISTSGTASVYTTATNNNNILDGHGVTFSENYWATVDGTGLISALTADDGSSFSDSSANYTVGAGTAGVQTLTGTSFANTIRFASAADGTDAVDSASTLDLGGNTLYFGNGGVLVGSDVTTDTAITDGTLSNGNGNLNFINYSSGTLTIGANLTEGTYAFDGGGTFVVTGNNLVSNPGLISINSGKVILGSAEGLGSGAKLDFGSANTTLDLDGHNLSVSQILTDPDYAPGNTAATAGLNTNIINSAAGTLSTLTIAANANLSGNDDTSDLYGYNDLGYYQGGLSEAAGAIIAIDIEQGTPASGGTQGFVLGTANPIGDQSGANVNNALGMEGTNTVFTGDITVGANAELGYTGYGFVETMGALDLNGNLGIYGEQANGMGVTYLTGTGGIVQGPSAGNGTLYVNVTGTNDTFAGTFGTSSDYANTSLVLGGGSTLNLSNGIWASGVATTDDSHLITAGSFSGNGGLNINGNSSITLNGTGGQELGGDQIILYNGTINIAPTGSGQNVLVTGADNRYYDQMQLGGGAAINLDAGHYSSLTVELGQSSGNDGGFYTYTQLGSTLTIGSAQGLAALGTTNKFIILASNFASNTPYLAQEPYGIVQPWITGVNMAPGSSQNATFLSYQGTGLTSDGGFTPYAYNSNPNNGLVTVNNLGNAAATSVEDVTTNQALSANAGMYALEVDNGANIDTTNGRLYLGYGGNANNGGLILNGGASITGANGVQFDNTMSVYTDLDNGTIQNLTAAFDIWSKNGAGTLFLTGPGENLGYSIITINGGALDVGNVSGSNIPYTEIALQGGVLQGHGNLNENLVDGFGQGITFNYNQEGASNLGGGFSAAGGALFVTLNGNAQLVWGTGTGGTANFLSQNAPLLFGSTTSTGVVDFSNRINLGVVEGGNQGATALYSRVIQVTANSSDVGDPLAYADYAVMDGVISSSNPYLGLAKTGDGVLLLDRANTYTGATSIEGGTLEISQDSNLGAAPTAAYALNVGPDVSGAALTPGAVQINSGATLGFYQHLYSTIALNSNRQLLLASGDGSVASNIDIENGGEPTTVTFGGVIADYVGETGSLNVEGSGTFDYSGTSANTGSYSVTGGTLLVSGDGNINSSSGVKINASAVYSGAEFNYQSTVGLSKAVTYGAGGGTFAYNTSAAYTGSPSLNVGAKDVVSGSGNLGLTAVSIGSGGTITPGQLDPTPGTLTTGATSFLTGGNYNFLVADATGAAGTGYSTVAATSLDISSLTAGSFTINLESLNGNGAGDASDFDPDQNFSFVLVNAADGITGTFNAADFTVDAFANNGASGFSNDVNPYASWSVSEQGDNLVLSYTVPEPSTDAMMIVGLLLVGLCLRRKLA